MDEESPVTQCGERIDGYWLVLAYANNPAIKLDVRMIDRALADDRELILEVDNLRIALLTGDATVAAGLAADISPFTRSAPIRRPEVLDYCKALLDVTRTRGSKPPVLFFGNDRVWVTDKYLYVGDFVCHLEDVSQYLEVAAPLPLPKGYLQAGLAMLLVADRSRKEDVATLTLRISEYERG